MQSLPILVSFGSGKGPCKGASMFAREEREVAVSELAACSFFLAYLDRPGP